MPALSSYFSSCVAAFLNIGLPQNSRAISNAVSLAFTPTTAKTTNNKLSMSCGMQGSRETTSPIRTLAKFINLPIYQEIYKFGNKEVSLKGLHVKFVLAILSVWSIEIKPSSRIFEAFLICEYKVRF